MALFPFWWMLNTSLKQPVDIFGGVTLYPHHPTTDNYHRLFHTYHFATFLQNSIIIVIFSVSASLVVGTLAAYSADPLPPAVRPQPVGVGGGALVVRMLPPILLVIPLYIMLGPVGPAEHAPGA